MYMCVLSSPTDENDPPYDPSPYLNGRDWEHYVLNSQDVEGQVRAIVKKGVDVFINLCDGTPDDLAGGVGMVQLLEKMGAAFTGADSRFFDPTRAEMKQAARAVGVPVPGYVFAATPDEVDIAARTLRFPLIVKHPHGYASVGLRRESRVPTPETLHKQAALTIHEFGRTLIEEFIEGREFTALIAENPDDPNNPLTFKPVEFLFPPGESFKHYDMKWKEYRRMKALPVSDPAIETRLRDLTSRLFLAMNGNGYARCDFRMNTEGEIFMLEINPNCGIFYPSNDPGSADFSLYYDPIGHAGFLDLIIHLALKRHASERENQFSTEIASKA